MASRQRTSSSRCSVLTTQKESSTATACAYCHVSDARQRRRSRRLHAALRPGAVRRAGAGGGRRRARHGALPARRGAAGARLHGARGLLSLRSQGPRPALGRAWPSTSPTCCARRAARPTSCTSSGSRCSRSTSTCCAPTAARGSSPPTTSSRASRGRASSTRQRAALRAHGRHRRPHRARARAAGRRARRRPAPRVHVIPHGILRPARVDAPAAARAAPPYDGPVVALLRPAAPVQGHRRARRGVAGDRATPSCGSSARRAWTPRRCTPPRRRACASSSASSARARPRRSSAAPTSPCCPTARSSSRACSPPRWASACRSLLTDVGSASPRSPRPARPSSSPPATPAALHEALAGLLADPARRAQRSPMASRCGSPTRCTAGARSRAPTSPSTPVAAALTAWPSSSGCAVGLLVYAQVGYPLLLELLGRLRRRPAPVGDRGAGGAAPSVALVVAAHREAAIIEAKVANARDARLAGRPPGGHRRLRRLAPTTRRARARAAGADVVLELPARRQGPRAGRRGRCARGGELLAFSRRQRALGARRAARARGARSPTRGRLRLRPGALRQRGRHQPGGPVLALRDGDPRRASPSCTPSRRATAPSTRCAPRPTCASTPIMGHDLVAALQHGQARLARRVRPRGARDREDGPDRRGRVRAQAAHDEPRLADRPARRAARSRAAIRRSTRSWSPRTGSCATPTPFLHLVRSSPTSAPPGAGRVYVAALAAQLAAPGGRRGGRARAACAPCSSRATTC